MSFTKRKVLAIIITKDIVEPECYNSVINQDYPDMDVMVHIARPVKYFTSEDTKQEAFVNQYINCPENRNKARRMALASDADYFMFIDSDTVLPKNAISVLMLHKKDAIGGYYKTHDDKVYVAGGYKEVTTEVEGKEVKYNVFLHCRDPLPKGILPVNMIGLGCALVSRKLLELVDFEDGLSRYNLIPGETLDKPITIKAGECMAFGMDANAKGFQLFMTEEVIVEKHLVREGHYSTINKIIND